MKPGLQCPSLWQTISLLRKFYFFRGCYRSVRPGKFYQVPGRIPVNCFDLGTKRIFHQSQFIKHPAELRTPLPAVQYRPLPERFSVVAICDSESWYATLSTSPVLYHRYQRWATGYLPAVLRVYSKIKRTTFFNGNIISTSIITAGMILSNVSLR